MFADLFPLVSLRSALRRFPRPVLPPSLELWAQLGSLQPGSQLQPAPFLLLHQHHGQHQLFHFKLLFPVWNPFFYPHRHGPRAHAVSPASTPSERVGRKEEPATPPQHPRSHHPSAGLRLWAGTWPRSQAGNRQPVHVALTPLSQTPATPLNDSRHLWSWHTQTHTNTLVFACRSLPQVYNLIAADSWTWVKKSLSDECIPLCMWKHTQTLTLCVCVFTSVRPSHPPPRLSTVNVFSELYNSADY